MPLGVPPPPGASTAAPPGAGPARACGVPARARGGASAFLGFVVARCKEADVLRAEMPPALKHCVDPAKFVMDAFTELFPVDRREVWSPADLAWACMFTLEVVVLARSQF